MGHLHLALRACARRRLRREHDPACLAVPWLNSPPSPGASWPTGPPHEPSPSPPSVAGTAGQPAATPVATRITAEDAREAEALHEDAGDRSLAAAQRLMAELAGTLEGLDDLAPYLDRLVAAVNANIDGCDAVGVTVVMEDRPRTAAYTTAGHARDRRRAVRRR